MSEPLQFIYPAERYIIVTQAKMKIIDKVLGEIIEERSYLYREEKYWRILSDEIDGKDRIFSCVEATMEDWMAIKNTLFPAEDPS